MNQLIYRKQAAVWTEALPLGNGRIGAMHFGGIETDRFQINEDTLWSGPPKKDVTFDDRETLQKVRGLIEQEKYQSAIDETKNMFGPYTQAYVPFGNIYLHYLHGGIAQNYQRTLNIEEAISTVAYEIGSVKYTREAFISHPDQVMVVHLTSSDEGMLNLDVSIDSLLKSRLDQTKESTVLQGICPEVCSPNYFHDLKEPIVYGEFEQSHAIHFEGELVAEVEGGTIGYEHEKISIRQATKATLYFAVATSFKGFDQLPGTSFEELRQKNAEDLQHAMRFSYEEIKQRHIEDYQQLFQRVRLSLHKQADDTVMDTDNRIRTYGAEDPQSIELLFQYGRYLMIASSRKGTQPANLQGIWNDLTRAPWSSNYTLNINTEMNYWPAEVTNLAECHEPLLKAVREMDVTGSKMVSERYGLRGWTSHHNTDIWRHAHPVGDNRHGDPSWAFWPMSGPWLCRHLWEHFEYSQAEQYLAEEAFPSMKGSALFCLDWLIEDENGYLITSPSTSPEHFFYAENGELGSVTKGATMDLQIIWDLFNNCMKAAEVLGIEEQWIEEIKVAKEKLHPLQIGKYGQLQEWLKDYEDCEIHHRHVSHVYGVYPGEQITEGPLLKAVEQTLNRRGDAGTGWSLGWKICLWARLQDGERIRELFKQLFTVVESNREVMTGGGVYPNLLGAHPPFQIDGNFSFTAGIAEMLLQSHKGYLELLPALPSTWNQGEISGLRARGGVEVNIEWEERKVSKIVLISSHDQQLKIKSNQSMQIIIDNGEKEWIQPENGFIAIQLGKGQVGEILYY